jgi:hypothetical protein
MENFTIHYKDSEFAHVCLDTAEGSDCFGHWMYECALFLPYLVNVSKEIGKPLKIVLNSERRYKKVVLHDFGFSEENIIYSERMTTHGHYWQMNHVLPNDDTSMCIIPKFLYTWPVTPETDVFFEHVSKFVNSYNISNVEKNIPYLFLKRSQKENYARNSRAFLNIEEVSSMLSECGVKTLQVDNLDSLGPQIQTVRSAKVIILEMGSAFTINAGWFAKDSHVIILNDYFNAYTCDHPFMKVLRKQMAEHGVTFEIFTSQPVYDADFVVPVKALRERVLLNRVGCVVCGSCSFTNIATFTKFPIMAISNNSISDNHFTKQLDACVKCSCLQLRQLVDPATLYSSNYMNAVFSPIWADHHMQFSNFILSSSNTNKFLEIGANSGGLYKLLKQKRNASYATLDMFKHPDLPDGVEFVQGSCESYKYTGQSVIASHVFEHLYNPHGFIKQMADGGVREVFIAIPNFRHLLESQSLQTIHSQHTFYCGKEYVMYMFSKHGYTCEKVIDYTGEFKSCFLKFSLTGCVESELPTTDIELYEKIYIAKVASISRLVLPEKTYIMPSGIYGQFLYYFLEQKSHVLGFLDNNLARHGQTLYGTNKNVYHPSKVDLTDCVIAICQCPYTSEIVSELQTKYPDVKLLLLDQ